MNKKATSFFICLSIILVFTSRPSFSANRYWVGPGLPILGGWNNILNWSATSGGLTGLSIPGSSDVAIFDGGNTMNCTIDANVNVAGIVISSGYTGTITVNSGLTITTGASGFSQAAGTFTGNSSSMTINGPFNLTGGTFTSTAGTLQISSGYTYSGGTFNHNNGTVSFSATETITGNTSFYNILFVAGGGIYTVASGTTISSSNNVTISGSFSCTINTGIVEIKKDLTLSSSSNNGVNGGSATFLFDGTGTQNINSALSSITIGTNEKICALPNVEINKTSGSLNLIGLINMNGSTWKTTAGAALVNAGTSTLNIISGVTFSGQNLSLYNIHILANGQLITLTPATYTLTSTNNVTINGTNYYQLNTGILEILGDLTLINTNNSATNGGSGTFLFDGTGVQNINSSVASPNFTCILPSVQINKSSGTLNLTGVINFGGASWNTIAGAALINPGTSVVNVTKATTISGQNLSLYDIVITGTSDVVTISSGVMWTSTHLLTLAGGSNWYQIDTGTLNAKGDVLVTNTNTSISVGGNAVLLFDGTANQTLTGSGVSGGGRLPQVQINKTGGTLTFSGIISTDNNWTYIAGTVDAATNASTIDFYKTSVINGQGASATMAFYNVIFSGFISLGGNMDVNGNFTIRNGVNNRLDVTSTNNYQVNVAGNWTNNNSVTASSFNQQNGKVVFDGGAAQALTLDIATNTEVFYNMEINNSSTGLTLNAPVTISNNINFITGNISSSASALLLLNNTVTATGASNNSFVSGPVRKTGNQAFTFPVGKNTAYAPISISAPSVTSDQFTAEYFSADPNPSYDVTSKDVTLINLSRCEYWDLERTTGTSNVTVGLSWDTRSCVVTNLSDMKVALWNGTQWKDEGNGGTTGTLTAGMVFSAAAVTSFGPFTLANITLPLSAGIVSFTGECTGTTVLLNWKVGNSMNLNYFTVERSTSNTGWEKIGTIGNKDNSTDYLYTDRQAHAELSYYRLKQTNLDETAIYFEAIAVKNCNDDDASEELIVYPNPSNGTFNFHLKNNEEQVNSMEVFNTMGEKVYYNSSQSSITLSEQPAGVYFLHINLPSKTIVEKLVVK